MSKNKNHSHGSANATKKIHHDWRFWTAIVLMLVGISIYVLSDNESLGPGGTNGPGVPVEAE